MPAEGSAFDFPDRTLLFHFAARPQRITIATLLLTECIATRKHAHAAAQQYWEPKR
jgi:hypothetical protein